jgi:ABC-2 type transport system ATP-binding protein
MNTLLINKLNKTYSNKVKALDNVSLEVKNGIFGLLGKNGAGKSSLMRSITTLQDVDSGSIMFNNIDVIKKPKELKKVLGYLPQSFGVYPKMSAENFVNHIALLKGIVIKGERIHCVNYLLNKVIYTIKKSWQ